MSDILFFVMHTLSVGFLTKILMIDHPWPFVEEDRYVSDGEYRYPFDVMHRIKKVLGFYRKTELFREWEPRSTVLWACPYCLSFWIGLIVAVVIFFLGIQTNQYLVFSVFAIPFSVGYLMEWLPEEDD